MKSLAIFCGSSSGVLPEYTAAAQDVGRLLAAAGIELVYGGGRVGLMGVVADATLAAGGRVVGVIPRLIFDREIAHRGVTELIVVETMHERKAIMADRADAFVALPGGIGTLDELFEQWTWGLLGIHGRPCGLLNVAGYFDPMVALIEHMTAQGFLSPKHAGMLAVETAFPALLERLRAYEPPTRKYAELGQGGASSG
jgi:uncharacterized protein (TIGR00730 family)